MNELTTFTNSEFGSIRTVQIGTEPWFVGKDVALALGYERPTDAVRKHVDDEDRGISKMETPSGAQNTAIINESGLYCLILSSKLPGAKRFKHWVTREVLPTLRKTGKYESGQGSARRALTPDDYLRAAAIIATCKNERLPYALHLIQAAGIDMTGVIGGRKRLIVAERDTKTGELINTACCEYGVSLRAIERASGIYAAQLGRIRRGESYPSPVRAAIIQSAIRSLIPEIEEQQKIETA